MTLSSFRLTGLHLLATETLASNGNDSLLKIYLMLHNFQGIYNSWISWLMGLLFLVYVVTFSSIFSSYTNKYLVVMFFGYLQKQYHVL